MSAQVPEVGRTEMHFNLKKIGRIELQFEKYVGYKCNVLPTNILVIINAI